MKRTILIFSLLLCTISARAQFDLGSLLNKAKDAVSEVAGDTTSSAAEEALPEGLQKLLGALLPEVEIPGTWSYVDVAVEFESEDALTKAGGKVAAETVEGKIAPMLAKVGIQKGAFSFTFNEDGTVTTTLAQKTVSGTWKFDKEQEVVTLGIKGKEFTTRMVVCGDNICILFGADKLLELIKTISAKSSNTTLATIGAIAKAYDGMNIGFECEKIND